jgi:hypothetical protein
MLAHPRLPHLCMGYRVVARESVSSVALAKELVSVLASKVFTTDLSRATRSPETRLFQQSPGSPRSFAMMDS